jgi:rhodanese-related sulfurtransferase
VSRVDGLLAEARERLARVDPAIAATLAASGGVIVDIRLVADRVAEGVVPGAWIVDRNVLEWRLDPTSPDRLDGVDDTFEGRPLIVMCNDGYASSLAAAGLHRLGLAGATDMEGGFRAWSAAGLPVVPGPGLPC